MMLLSFNYRVQYHGGQARPVVSIMNCELITNSLVHLCCHYSFSVDHKGILMIFIGDCIRKGYNYNVLGESIIIPLWFALCDSFPASSFHIVIFFAVYPSSPSLQFYINVIGLFVPILCDPMKYFHHRAPV